MFLSHCLPRFQSHSLSGFSVPLVCLLFLHTCSLAGLSPDALSVKTLFLNTTVLFTQPSVISVLSTSLPPGFCHSSPSVLHPCPYMPLGIILYDTHPGEVIDSC